jgi:hypothetical protein
MRCAATWTSCGGRTPAGVYASQLKRLGISGTLAEIYADCVDWHQIARLVQHGCPRRSPCASSADTGREDPAR